MESLEQQTPAQLSDDSMREMLLLAERLREQRGELDDSAILAVSEATGAAPEYVRLAVRMLPEKKKQNFAESIRSAFLTLEPDVRRHVITAIIATSCALCSVFASHIIGGENLFGALGLILLGVGVWNMSISKEPRVAAISGALFGGIYFVAGSLFSLLAQLMLHGHQGEGNSLLLIPYVLGGGVIGLFSQRIIARVQKNFGIKDPMQERQELLRQLVQIQDKLRSGEQSMTFLSLDIVGSTKMKANADPLSVEFTFTEFHQFVDAITKKYGGRVHSTAGDGVICAFQHPQQAFGAAKNVQTGLVELNTFRNKLSMPIVLRAGIHTGTVNAPTKDDVKSVNFAHVIDVAAHLQHCCPPGGIAVSEDAAKLLPQGPISVGTQKIQTDDCHAFIWEPRQKLLTLDAAVPPPSPF